MQFQIERTLLILLRRVLLLLLLLSTWALSSVAIVDVVVTDDAGVFPLSLLLRCRCVGVCFVVVVISKYKLERLFSQPVNQPTRPERNLLLSPNPEFEL